MNVYPNDDPDTAAKKLAKEGKKNQNRREDNEKPVPVYSTYKYSRPFLHEGITDEASILESIKTAKDLDKGNGKVENITQNIVSERSLLPPTPPQMPSLTSLTSPYCCYHSGCDFQTDDEHEYRRHGTAKHLKNPLLFPSKFEIEKYGLQPQGKEWEI